MANSGTAGLDPGPPSDVLTFPPVKADSAYWETVEKTTPQTITFPAIKKQTANGTHEVVAVVQGTQLYAYRTEITSPECERKFSGYTGCKVKATSSALISNTGYTLVETIYGPLIEGIPYYTTITYRQARFIADDNGQNTLIFRTLQEGTSKTQPVSFEAAPKDIELFFISNAYRLIVASTHILSDGIDTTKKMYINGATEYIDKDNTTWSLVDGNATLTLEYDGDRTLKLTTTYTSDKQADYIPPTIVISNEPTSSDACIIWAGSANADSADSAPFHVTNTGKLVAKNIEAKGVINATSGKIGNFTIASDGRIVYSTGGTVNNTMLELWNQPLIADDERMPDYNGFIKSLRVRNLIAGDNFTTDGIEFLGVNSTDGLTIEYLPKDSNTSATKTSLSLTELEKLLCQGIMLNDSDLTAKGRGDRVCKIMTGTRTGDNKITAGKWKSVCTLSSGNPSILGGFAIEYGGSDSDRTDNSTVTDTTTNNLKVD